MTIDRAALCRALERLKPTQERAFGGQVPRDEWNALLGAAEAHLQTLPKTKIVWQLTGWTGDANMPHELICGYDDPQDAEYEAVKWLRKGGSVMSLRQIEVEVRA